MNSAPKDQPRHYLSSCHHAEMHLHSSDEGTNYYVCDMCLQGCDPVAAHPTQAKEETHLKRDNFFTVCGLAFSRPEVELVEIEATCYDCITAKQIAAQPQGDELEKKLESDVRDMFKLEAQRNELNYALTGIEKEGMTLQDFEDDIAVAISRYFVRDILAQQIQAARLDELDELASSAWFNTHDDSLAYVHARKQQLQKGQE